MTPHVMKRDGCKVPFKSERIQEAILRAAKAAGVDDADYCATVAEVVSSQMNERSQVDINEIQTAVENQLMAGPYKQLARAYIEYRHDRDVQREKRGRLSERMGKATSGRWGRASGDEDAVGSASAAGVEATASGPVSGAAGGDVPSDWASWQRVFDASDEAERLGAGLEVRVVRA